MESGGATSGTGIPRAMGAGAANIGGPGGRGGPLGGGGRNMMGPPPRADLDFLPRALNVPNLNAPDLDFLPSGMGIGTGTK